MKYLQFILQNNRGFTLVELLIGMVILVIILGAIVGVLDASLRSQQHNFEQAANTQDERQIISFISTEIRNATSVSSPNVGSDSTSLSYQKTGDTLNRTISIGTGNDSNTIVITDTSGAIVQRMGVGRVHTLEFTRDATITRKITVDLTLRNSSRSNAPTNTVSTIVYTLN